MDVQKDKNMINLDPKSNGQSGNQNNKIKRVSGNGVFMSVTKKAEKISTALYMITDFIPESDPMRQKIRQATLNVLSDSRTLSLSLTGDLYFQLAKVIARSWELVSLIEVCVVVGFISDMNYQIIKNALVDFISDLRNRQRVEGFKNMDDLKMVDGGAGNFNLKSDFFKLNDEDRVQIEEESGSSKDKINISEPVLPPKAVSISKGQEKNIMSFKRSVEPKSESGGEISDRKQRILELIRDKKEISIKDISTHFSDLSQKTVQRDLNSLIEDGRILRTGEKRWSRYSII